MKKDDKEKEIKKFYSSYEDKIAEKRFSSLSDLRRYVHEAQYQSILQYVEPGMQVLDAGCGDGMLSIMMAKKGAVVTGCDISEPNIARCKIYAKENDVEINFLVADAENLPFQQDSFDLVVSSHVLEHLPNFEKGLLEVMRVSKKRSIVAIPTILNACSWVQVGGGMFWLKGKKSVFVLPIGFIKMLLAFILRKEGVDEKYAGNNVPHIFRFPYIMKKKIKENGLYLVEYEASSICFPYFVFLVPIIKKIDQFRSKKIIRNFGYGTTFVIEKQ